MSIVARLWGALRRTAKYWALPLIAVVVLFVALAVIKGGSIKPFVYSNF